MKTEGTSKKRQRTFHMYLVTFMITLFMVQVGFAGQQKTNTSRKQLPKSKKSTANRYKKKLKRIVGMAVAPDTGHTFAWYSDGTVSSGTSDDLDKHRAPYRYILPRGKSPADIVGMAMYQKSYGSRIRTYAWYRDGTFSRGISNNLTKHGPFKYELPSGKRPQDIVGMAVAKNNHYTFAWYSDGTVSAGWQNKQGKYRLPYRYVMPLGINPNQIVGMAITEDTGHTFAWYSNGTVSSGVSDHLDRHRKPYRYTFPK